MDRSAIIATAICVLAASCVSQTPAQDQNPESVPLPNVDLWPMVATYTRGSAAVSVEVGEVGDVLDRDGAFIAAFPVTVSGWGGSAEPTTYWVSRDGKIVRVDLGCVHYRSDECQLTEVRWTSAGAPPPFGIGMPLNNVKGKLDFLVYEHGWTVDYTVNGTSPENLTLVVLGEAPIKPNRVGIPFPDRLVFREDMPIPWAIGFEEGDTQEIWRVTSLNATANGDRRIAEPFNPPVFPAEDRDRQHLFPGADRPFIGGFAALDALDFLQRESSWANRALDDGGCTFSYVQLEYEPAEPGPFEETIQRRIEFIGHRFSPPTGPTTVVD